MRGDEDQDPVASEEVWEKARNIVPIDLLGRVQSFKNDLHKAVKGPSTREEGIDLTQSYEKSPYTNRTLIKQSDNTKRHQNYDYATIADRLRTVSWTTYSRHPTGLRDPILPFYRKSYVIKMTHVWKFCK